jgi:hypothetical protein
MRQSLAEHIVRALARGLAYKVAWAAPLWLAAAVLVLMVVFSLIGRV